MDSRAKKNMNWMNADQHVKDNKETFKRRIKYLKPFLKRKKSDVLEIGCSSGFMTLSLKKKGFKYCWCRTIWSFF